MPRLRARACQGSCREGAVIIPTKILYCLLDHTTNRIILLLTLEYKSNGTSYLLSLSKLFRFYHQYVDYQIVCRAEQQVSAGNMGVSSSRSESGLDCPFVCSLLRSSPILGMLEIHVSFPCQRYFRRYCGHRRPSTRHDLTDRYDVPPPTRER